MKSSKIISYIFLTVVLGCLYVCAVIVFLMYQNLQNSDVYNIESFTKDLKLSLVIVVPQLLIPYLIYFYLKKNKIKLVQ